MSAMTLRLTAVLLAAALLTVGCSGSDDVPDDQAIKPAAAPSGWTETELGPVTVSTPPEWTQQPTTQPAANLESTTWRAAEVDGVSAGGLDVRVITSPQQDARKAATALGISAQAELGARDAEPEEVVWPNAEAAYLLAYTSQVPTSADGSNPQPYRTRSLVLDLADGTQVQVTALVDEAQGAGLADDALSTVVLAETEEP